VKKIILLACLVFSSWVLATEPLYKPAGLYVYNKEVLVTKKRTAETASHVSADGITRIKNLKSAGFICVRKNQTLSICQKIETNLETPDFVQKSVDNYLGMGSFTFSGTGDATVVHDGASTEWLVYEDVLLGNYKINVYKIVKTNQNSWYAAFPISDEQGIANIEIKNQNTLALPLTLESKINGQTVAYFITATFKK
jgi:hypothetical protein